VDGELGSKKASMSVAEIRKACRAYAQRYVDLQKASFRRLGIFGQWDQPYMTMAPEYQAVIAKVFVDFFAHGFVYRGLKPVNWCINDRTALAEAEVEYETHTSPSIYVRFRLTSDPALINETLAGKEVYGLIWTTTPWTIPANMGIAFHPRYEYVAYETGGGVYLVAEGLLAAVRSALGWEEGTILARFPGARLDQTVYRHPFIDRYSLGILGDHVTLEQGTGSVHTAPGHGHEDYVAGMRNDIQVYCPVDAAGKLYHTPDEPGALPEELIGLTVFAANPVVIGLLRDAGALLAERKVEHSYPHCWRCHKPTIFRATEQWFIGMERNDLRQKALDAIRRVKWWPAWGEERIANMIATRPDWCISRQRTWGVPIIAFNCRQCDALLHDRAVLDRVVDLFRVHSADVWYERSAAELIGPGVVCGHCGGQEFEKERDILDVWLDSGCSHLAVLTEENGLPWPSDMYLEGGDQYRGWFHSSLLIGVGLRGEAPYRGCLTNGWTLDGEGRAMSKSLGNTIEPEKIISQFGADILRLWVSSVEFWEDVRLSDVILTRLTEAYRKIRNTFRYALGNLDGFDPAADFVADADLLEIDQWILTRAAELVARCRNWYDEYAFHRVYQATYAFCANDLSAVYFDILKDRLYTTATRSRARRSAQTALWRLTYALTRLFAPVLSFTCEEVWKEFRRPADAPSSVHMALFPEPAELSGSINPSGLSAWERLIAVRDDVLKSLEAARQEKTIGAPLEARVRLTADAEIYPLLERYAGQLASLLIVSEVELMNGASSGVAVEVSRATGVKCERCWKYTHDVGADVDLPSVCGPCANAVKEMVAG
jgi:isoleucyl-tRNA synthetase